VHVSLLESVVNFLNKHFGEQALRRTDYSRHGYHLDLQIPLDRVRELASFLKRSGFFLETVTALDRGSHLELVYFYNQYKELCRIKAWAPAAKGSLAPSLSSILPAADWHEREVFDFFGQHFSDHPNLKRILLPQDADFHPLLKDFKAGPELNGESFDMERA
jgi:NADH-quinone oxidoreductase subunit C